MANGGNAVLSVCAVSFGNFRRLAVCIFFLQFVLICLFMLTPFVPVRNYPVTY